MHRILNIIAIITFIVGTVFCILAFFTQTLSLNSTVFGLTVDQAYSSSTNLVAMAIAIWIGTWFNYTILNTITH